MRTCYFALAGGLNGCYMPDSDLGSYAVRRRKDLIAAVRNAIEICDMPQSALREVKWMRVWAHAKKHGFSSLHFSIGNKRGFGVQFSGLTKAEYVERLSAEDY